LDAIEHGDKIVFLHQLKPGAANQSYGLQVAQLAGVPNDVIQAAKHKLATLESQRSVGSEGQELQPQQDLFAQPDNAVLIHKIGQINPDELTPKAALELLYELKKLV